MAPERPPSKKAVRAPSSKMKSGCSWPSGLRKASLVAGPPRRGLSCPTSAGVANLPLKKTGVDVVSASCSRRFSPSVVRAAPVPVIIAGRLAAFQSSSSFVREAGFGAGGRATSEVRFPSDMAFMRGGPNNTSMGKSLQHVNSESDLARTPLLTPQPGLECPSATRSA